MVENFIGYVDFGCVFFYIGMFILFWYFLLVDLCLFGVDGCINVVGLYFDLDL